MIDGEDHDPPGSVRVGACFFDVPADGDDRLEEVSEVEFGSDSGREDVTAHTLVFAQELNSMTSGVFFRRVSRNGTLPESTTRKRPVRFREPISAPQLFTSTARMAEATIR